AWFVQHENGSICTVDVRDDYSNFPGSCEWVNSPSKKEDCVHIMTDQRFIRQTPRPPK
ncbi:unnamed protein product, partial [Didymodactylos carnosus]